VAHKLKHALEEELKYRQVYKQHHSSVVQFKFNEDPKFLYFKQCYQDSELELPVLNYVREKTLCLKSYTLSIGHCKALAKVFGFF
jgi:hypothetical protein